jgi:hypothetical protein
MADYFWFPRYSGPTITSMYVNRLNEELRSQVWLAKLRRSCAVKRDLRDY